MTTDERDKILLVARKYYEFQGCVFPKDDREMIEYLYDSEHPDEERALLIGIEAHNIYNSDSMELYDFFEWHGL